MNILQLIVEDKIPYILRAQGEKLEARAQQDTGQATTASDILQKLEIADPTGKNHKYLQWITNMYIKNQFRLEDVHRVQADMKEFERVKSTLELKDINQYKTLPDLYAVLDPIDGKEVVSNRQADKNEGKTLIESGQADMIIDVGGTKVIKLNTEAAAIYFGRGTRWCTAARENNMFARYNEDGPIYVIIHKGEKYQIHFESGQMMDADDASIKKETFVQLYTTAPTNDFFKKHEDELGQSYVKACAGDDNERNTSFDKVQSYVEAVWEYDAFPTTLMNHMLHDISICVHLCEEYFRKPWPVLEKAMLDNIAGASVLMSVAAQAVTYCHRVKKARWPEFEARAMANYSKGNQAFRTAVIEYAELYRVGGWPELEDAVLDAARTATGPIRSSLLYNAIEYAGKVKKARWPEIEPLIIDQGHLAFDYASQVIKGPWPEAEAAINSNMFARDAYAGLVRHYNKRNAQ